jgi:hypothetical protein
MTGYPQRKGRRDHCSQAGVGLAMTIVGQRGAYKASVSAGGM